MIRSDEVVLFHRRANAAISLLLLRDLLLRLLDIAVVLKITIIKVLKSAISFLNRWP
jgi:hypothetical protein